MSLEQLWAGWRHEYVAAAGAAERAGTDDVCVFCRIADSGPPSADNGVVWRGGLTLAVLNAYPYASGHLLVTPVRHVSELAELTAAESGDLWEATRTAAAALGRAYEPDGLNVGANLGTRGGGRHPPAPPSARPPPLVGGYELHDDGGRCPGHARIAHPELGAAPPGVAGGLSRRHRLVRCRRALG